MKLTPRLKAIASLIPPGCIPADIGTDHGYLPVYLVKNNICPYAVAGDKNIKPLEKARELVRSLGMEKSVMIRLGDGLEIIEEKDEVNVIIIAGMGGKNICSILKREISRMKGIKMLILQPMVEIPLVRRWIGENGFKIVDEKLAREGCHFYEIIAAQPGIQEPIDEYLLELGPQIIENKGPLLKPYLKRKLNKFRIIVENLDKAEQEIEPRKYNYWIGLVKRTEEELKCLQEK